MADRSPCGTGTSAKLATLYKKGEIKVGQPFVYESFIGSQFKGVILDTTKVADYDAVIPQITGSAYLTGEATYVIDPDDPYMALSPFFVNKLLSCYFMSILL